MIACFTNLKLISYDNIIKTLSCGKVIYFTPHIAYMFQLNLPHTTPSLNPISYIQKSPLYRALLLKNHCQNTEYGIENCSFPLSNDQQLVFNTTRICLKITTL